MDVFDEADNLSEVDYNTVIVPQEYSIEYVNFEEAEEEAPAEGEDPQSITGDPWPQSLGPHTSFTTPSKPSHQPTQTTHATHQPGTTVWGSLGPWSPPVQEESPRGHLSKEELWQGALEGSPATSSPWPSQEPVEDTTWSFSSPSLPQSEWGDRPVRSSSLHRGEVRDPLFFSPAPSQPKVWQEPLPKKRHAKQHNSGFKEPVISYYFTLDDAIGGPTQDTWGKRSDTLHTLSRQQDMATTRTIEVEAEAKHRDTVDSLFSKLRENWQNRVPEEKEGRLVRKRKRQSQPHQLRGHIEGRTLPEEPPPRPKGQPLPLRNKKASSRPRKIGGYETAAPLSVQDLSAPPRRFDMDLASLEFNNVTPPRAQNSLDDLLNHEDLVPQPGPSQDITTQSRSVDSWQKLASALKLKAIDNGLSPAPTPTKLTPPKDHEPHQDVSKSPNSQEHKQTKQKSGKLEAFLSSQKEINNTIPAEGPQKVKQPSNFGLSLNLKKPISPRNSDGSMVQTKKFPFSIFPPRPRGRPDKPVFVAFGEMVNVNNKRNHK